MYPVSYTEKATPFVTFLSLLVSHCFLSAIQQLQLIGVSIKVKTKSESATTETRSIPVRFLNLKRVFNLIYIPLMMMMQPTCSSFALHAY